MGTIEEVLEGLKRHKDLFEGLTPHEKTWVRSHLRELAQLVVKVVRENAGLPERQLLSEARTITVSGGGLKVRELLEQADEATIIEGLGGERYARITIDEFNAVLAGQPQGEEGDLDVHGCPNAAFVCDGQGGPCVVTAYWSTEGWRVREHPSAPSQPLHPWTRLLSH